MKPLFHNKHFQITGILLLCLGLVMLFLLGYDSYRQLDDPDIPSDAIPFPNTVTQVSSDSLSIYDQVDFQKVHQEYQTTYLNLIAKINGMDTSKIDIEKTGNMYLEYSHARQDYRDTVDSLADLEKEQRLRCFSTMQSMILAIMYFDRKHQKHTSKYDPEMLLKEGIISEIPKCPQKGEYSIITKDGKRFFHCSKHGVLRN